MCCRCEPRQLGTEQLALLCNFAEVAVRNCSPRAAHNRLLSVSYRCVVDVKPRQLDTEQLALLCNFAEMAVREMEKDKLTGLQRGNSLAVEMTDYGMHRAVKALTNGCLVVDVRTAGWPVLFMNEQAADFVGKTRALSFDKEKKVVVQSC